MATWRVGMDRIPGKDVRNHLGLNYLTHSSGTASSGLGIA